MKQFLLIIAGFYIGCALYGQELQTNGGNKPDKFTLEPRPNSREYAVVLKGNDHERVLLMRKMSMLRYRQGAMNRKLLMQRRRQMINRQMIRQRRIHQQIMQRRQRMQGR